MADETEITDKPGAKREDGSAGGSEEAERGLFPDSEEWEERSFRKIVKRLDDDDVKAEYEGKEEVVEDAEDRLVEQFRSTFRFYIYRRIGPIMAVAVALGLLANRFIQPVPVQAYGLVANLVGTTVLAVNTTRGRYMIARLSLPRQDQTVLRESYARQTAATIAGLGAFLLGFLIQLVGVLLPP